MHKCFFLCISAPSFVLAEDQKRSFEKLVIYCDQYANLIPVSFVLGETPAPTTLGPYKTQPWYPTSEAA